jgi:hypothetical protein
MYRRHATLSCVYPALLHYRRSSYLPWTHLNSIQVKACILFKMGCTVFKMDNSETDSDCNPDPDDFVNFVADMYQTPGPGAGQHGPIYMPWVGAWVP